MLQKYSTLFYILDNIGEYLFYVKSYFIYSPKNLLCYRYTN